MTETSDFAANEGGAASDGFEDSASEITFSDDEGETFYAGETDLPYEDVIVFDDPSSGDPSRQVSFDPVEIEGEIWGTSQAHEPASLYDLAIAPDYGQSHERPDTRDIPKVSVFDAPDHIADRLWRGAGRDEDEKSPYQRTVDAARVLAKAPIGAPRIVIPGALGGGLPGATPSPPVGPVGPIAVGAAGAAAFLALLGGLAYVSARQGQTFEDRTRRRIFGQRLLDEGLINQEELDEYIRSGNLPDDTARRVAIHVLSERGDVDLYEVLTSGVTATGQPRDARTFWRLYVEQKGKLGLSPENLKRIEDGTSPRVDKTWVRTYPQHHGFEGRRLDHHHIEGTSVATPIPDLLHRWLFKALHWYVR